MEQLTREEIEMCQIAVSHVAEYKVNGNEVRWNNLWDKLERMQREICLTPRVPDGANVCRIVNHVYVDGICAECGSVESPRR